MARGTGACNQVSLCIQIRPWLVHGSPARAPPAPRSLRSQDSAASDVGDGQLAPQLDSGQLGGGVRVDYDLTNDARERAVAAARTAAAADGGAAAVDASSSDGDSSDDSSDDSSSSDDSDEGEVDRCCMCRKDASPPAPHPSPHPCCHPSMCMRLSHHRFELFNTSTPSSQIHYLLPHR